MILVDKALEDRKNNPVRIAVTGAGFINRGMTNKIINHTTGMDVSVIVNRTIENAITCFKEAGVEAEEVTTVQQLNQNIEKGLHSFTTDPNIALESELIDCLVEGTGTLHYATPIVLKAIEEGKHVVMLNAELDAHIGPLLSKKAEQNNLIYTGCDGDQPGTQMNLLRFVKSIGATPLVAGNIKGLLDHSRTPETQKSFAEQWGQTPEMVTSFADGTKISFEQAVVSNATGFTLSQRGMNGYEFDGFVDDALEFYDYEQLKESGGVVDYLLGAKPSPGVYVFASYEDSQQHMYLDYAKLGKGPLYSFYVPYHLCHFEVPNSVARATLFNDATISPLAGPQVDVIAIAKRDLKPGDVLDGLGGFDTYGTCETSQTVRQNNLLTMGQAQGCKIIKPVKKNDHIPLNSIEIPKKRLLDELRNEQDKMFDT